MARRSKFAEAAEAWMKDNAPGKAISTDDLWEGLSRAHPTLTTPAEHRKTPRTTCMRDLRKDGAFEIGARKVRLRQ
jgi:hypothetical protein